MLPTAFWYQLPADYIITGTWMPGVYIGCDSNVDDMHHVLSGPAPAYVRPAKPDWDGPAN